MKSEEFQFMMEKLITIVASTLAMKRSYIHEIYRGIEGKIM